jgi:hypothetical protein
MGESSKADVDDDDEEEEGEEEEEERFDRNLLKKVDSVSVNEEKNPE